MAFFQTAVTGLTTVVTAIGAGVGVWGVINLLEGYGRPAKITDTFIDALGFMTVIIVWWVISKLRE